MRSFQLWGSRITAGRILRNFARTCRLDSLPAASLGACKIRDRAHPGGGYMPFSRRRPDKGSVRRGAPPLDPPACLAAAALSADRPEASYSERTGSWEIGSDQGHLRTWHSCLCLCSCHRCSRASCTRNSWQRSSFADQVLIDLDLWVSGSDRFDKLFKFPLLKALPAR
jgi:hypothetical protein